MKNTLYNVDKIVKISKHIGGNYSGFDYSPPKTFRMFGIDILEFDERYSWGNGSFSCSKESIEHDKMIFRKDDNKYYYYPFIRICFVDKSDVEIPFTTIQEMEEKYNWWKENYPNLIEL